MQTASFITLNNDTKEWQLVEEGVELLKTIDEPVTVVAVAGLYRTGKSYFLNCVAGTTGAKSTTGPRVGSTSESCTRGIDICLPDAALAAPAKGGRLVLLDTEGLASMDQDENYDAQVFSLALLLSSYFVINSMGVIDEAAIDRLYLMTELSKTIQVSAAPADSAAELAPFFPPLLWLLRDFVLDLTADGKTISEQEYMEAAISARSTNQRRAAERNDIRQAIRELFPARRCRTLVRPAVDEESIRQAVKLEDAQLRPEFVKQMGTVRDELLAAAPVKSLYGSALDGSMLATLAQSYLDAMNAPGALPCIRSAWEFVVEERCRAAADDALRDADGYLAAAAAASPLPSAADWEAAAHGATAGALAAFDERAGGAGGGANASAAATVRARRAELEEKVGAAAAARRGAERGLSEGVRRGGGGGGRHAARRGGGGRRRRRRRRRGGGGGGRRVRRSGGGPPRARWPHRSLKGSVLPWVQRGVAARAPPARRTGWRRRRRSGRRATRREPSARSAARRRWRWRRRRARRR